MIYNFNAIVCLAVAWLLSFAIMYDKRHIRRAWKPVLILFVVEHCILAYGALEALRSHIAIQYRQVLFAAVLLAILIALLFALAAIRKPSSWWAKRDENL